MGNFMSDKELVLLFDRRDEAAIAELERKYGARCRGIAMGLLKNQADADECVNDAFLKVWNSIPPAAPEKLSAYVENIVRNKAIDRYRRERREKRIPPENIVAIDDLEELPENEPDGASAREIVDLIAEYLNGIDRKKRLIFIGRYYRERSMSELASELGVPEGTVMSSVHRTKKGLVEFLKKRGVSI
ncbi:MAG: RNA polymerase sigma factor [Clostridia bacterium]|nr:RNA polymerase sigma factor [Clostridia bacterium]